MGRRENKYQADLIKRLESAFPGCVVLKNDSSYLQGVPDLTLFVGDKWWWLEVKREAGASHRPNQDYYVDKANEMGAHGYFIYPENEEQIINEISRSLGAS